MVALPVYSLCGTHLCCTDPLKQLLLDMFCGFAQVIEVSRPEFGWLTPV